jgi:hypothetical protein
MAGMVRRGVAGQGKEFDPMASFYFVKATGAKQTRKGESMKVRMFLIVFILMTGCGWAQDTKDHFFGRGTVAFRGYSMLNGQRRTCNYTADMEIKSPALWKHLPYESAFSYTLRNLKPATTQDAFCYFRPYEGDFVALCRAFSLSNGNIGIDVPTLGVLTVAPTSPDVAAFWAADGQKVGTWGFAVTRLWYRLTVLSDGALEVLAFVPAGWDQRVQ